MSVEEKRQLNKHLDKMVKDMAEKEKKRVIPQEKPGAKYSTGYTERSELVKQKILNLFRTREGKFENQAKKSKEKRSKELKELQKATHEYTNFHYKPGVEARYWQAYWNYYGIMTGHKIKVPKYEGTLARKRELESNDLMLAYIPPELSTPEALTFLSNMYPGMRLNAEMCKNIKCENISGWINVEVGDRTPRTRTTEKQLKEQIERDGRTGMNLIVYIISSFNYQKLTGRHLDTQTWVRLLSSRLNGKVIDAGFRPDGSLHIDLPGGPDTIHESLGGRSVKKEENLNT